MAAIRHYKRVRMQNGKIANTTASSKTFGTLGTFAGTVDTAGADLACITVERCASSGMTTKSIWRIYHSSAAGNTAAQSTIIAGCTGSSIVDPLSGGGYQYWVDLRGSAFGRYLVSKLCAVTGSVRAIILCDLYKLETYPGATGVTGATGGNGFTSVSEVVTAS